jgi:hypothetical protein
MVERLMFVLSPMTVKMLGNACLILSLERIYNDSARSFLFLLGKKGMRIEGSVIKQ